MVSKRNCIIELVSYIESLGVKVNIGKTKARGNKGFFSRKNDCFRIDIAKGIDECSVLSTLLHEFAHYIHYKYDSSLKSLDFVFDELDDKAKEELINVTVEKVPKDFASSLYRLKEDLEEENKRHVQALKEAYPDFKVSKPFGKFERGITFFNFNMSPLQLSYLKLKSNRLNIARINAKINRLNKYYNQPSELWARFFELFFTDIENTRQLAPSITVKFSNIIEGNRIPEIKQVNKILQNF